MPTILPIGRIGWERIRKSITSNDLNKNAMKKIILSVAVVATAVIAGWNYQQSSKDMKKLFVENIAFSDIEA